jgi:GntR family transcriptional repressor for pyruvate dehydrogenase complex
MPRAVTAARSEKVSLAVARLIVKGIADRGLQPGSVLPAEHLMAKQYGVGRTSVREALRLLETQGLVIIRQGTGGGPVVGAPDGSDFGQTLTMYLQIHQVRFRQIIEAMAELDGLMAAMLARKVKAGEMIDVDELVAAGVSELVSLRTDDEYLATAVGFHDILRRLAGNYILDLTGAAVAHIFNERWLGVHNHQWSREERTLVAKQHRAITQAIRRGSADRARGLAADHLLEVGEMAVNLYPAVMEEVVDWR